MAFVLRWFNLVLIFIFFVLALVGTVPLPLFTRRIDGFLDQTGSMQVTLWSIRASVIDVDVAGAVPPQSASVAAEPAVRTNFLNCSEARARFRAAQGCAIGGTVLGFYAFLLSLLMAACRLKVKLPLFLFLLLAFLAELIAVIVGAVLFTRGACKDKPNAMSSFKNDGYKLSTAYILQIVACVGYLVCFILTPFTQELWCGKC